jgi:tetratricopeptide (TPR) repeat protein
MSSLSPAVRALTRSALTLSLLVASYPLAAQEGSPEDLLKAISASKLHYEMGTPGQVKKPVESLRCPPRSAAARVVQSASGIGGTVSGAKAIESWKPAAAAAPHFAEAEKLFAAESYAAAGQAYGQALELDPAYAPGWSRAGDIARTRKDLPAALTSYKKALALDSTLAAVHRSLGEVLAKLGRLPEAQDEYVKTLVYDPSSGPALEGLQGLGPGAGFTVARREFLPPEGVLGEPEAGKVAIALAPEQKQWLPYFLCKAVWRNEPSYRTQRLGKEGTAAYNWTVQEETECLVSYLVGNLNATETEIREAAKKANPSGELADIPLSQVLAAAPPLTRHLREVADAGLLPGYALYAVLGRGCPLAIALLPDQAQADLERYIRRFVLVR